jgi:hypothetical protein
MAVGLPTKTTYANGDVFSASDINDTNGTINLIGQTNNFYAGKNRIINGDYSINQRNFTTTSTNGTFGFDRFYLNYTQAAGSAPTYSAQTFTAGTAPVAGYESKNFARLVTSGQAASGDYAALIQRVEDVRTFAGQTVTLSFWAKASSGTPKVGASAEQNFGTGGSSAVANFATTTSTISTSWARYSVSFAVPSVSGKTIGTDSHLTIYLFTSVGSGVSSSGFPAVGLQNATIDFWGIQLESGSTATAFQTASGNSFQGELAMCQRYYWRNTPGTAYGGHSGIAITNSSTNLNIVFNNPTSMRVQPYSIDFANLAVFDTSVVTGISTLSIVSSQSGLNSVYVNVSGSGFGGLGRVQYVINNNNTGGYFGASAEL